MSKPPLKFDGDGFEKGEFEESERSQLREMKRHYETNFVDVSDLLPLQGLLPLAALFKHWKFIIGCAAVGLVLGGRELLEKWGFF